MIKIWKNLYREQCGESSEKINMAGMVHYWKMVEMFTEKFNNQNIMTAEEQSHSLINYVYSGYGDFKGE